MDRTEINDLVAALARKKAALDKEIQDASKELFRDTSAQIFEKYPELETFAWVQFTDYFNDGEPLEFRVRNDQESIQINDEEYFWGLGEEEPRFYEDLWSLKRSGWFVSSWDKEMVSMNYTEFSEEEVPWKARVRHEVALLLAAICEIDDDILKDVFGDHVEIKVSREGIEVEDYTDHD